PGTRAWHEFLELDGRRMVAARGEPIAERGACPARPRPQVGERHRLEVDELVGREAYLARRKPDVVREDDLVQARERVGAEILDDLSGQPELLFDLAQHRVVRRLVRLEESGN